MTPYVTMSVLTLGENVLSTKARQPMMLPAMQTVRHPNLLVSALTTGPNQHTILQELIQLINTFITYFKSPYFNKL